MTHQRQRKSQSFVKTALMIWKTLLTTSLTSHERYRYFMLEAETDQAST